MDNFNNGYSVVIYSNRAINKSEFGDHKFEGIEKIIIIDGKMYEENLISTLE